MLAAGILIYSGVQVRILAVGWTSPSLLLWVVGITNAMNLLDNMDGLSGGVATIAAVYFTLLAAMSGQYLSARWRLLAGVCAGFLVYNWNLARIFMATPAACSSAFCWRLWRSN